MFNRYSVARMGRIMIRGRSPWQRLTSCDFRVVFVDIWGLPGFVWTRRPVVAALGAARLRMGPCVTRTRRADPAPASFHTSAAWTRARAKSGRYLHELAVHHAIVSQGSRAGVVCVRWETHGRSVAFQIDEAPQHTPERIDEFDIDASGASTRTPRPPTCSSRRAHSSPTRAAEIRGPAVVRSRDRGDTVVLDVEAGVFKDRRQQRVQCFHSANPSRWPSPRCLHTPP